jgi:hypothetical protein
MSSTDPDASQWPDGATRDRAKPCVTPVQGKLALPPGPALWLMLGISLCLWAGLVYGGFVIRHFLAALN